jgi:DNA-binding CsgD family transcriptional regulator
MFANDRYGPRTPSERENRVIELVAQGMKNYEVATAIGTTEHVVKNYLRVIYDKLGLWNRVELALWYESRRQEPELPAWAELDWVELRRTLPGRREWFPAALLLLTAGSLQVTQSFRGTFSAPSSGHIEQQTRLVAVLRHAVSASVHIRKNQRSFQVALPHRLP